LQMQRARQPAASLLTRGGGKPVNDIPDLHLPRLVSITSRHHLLHKDICTGLAVRQNETHWLLQCDLD
jgi:hypothetical protein